MKKLLMSAACLAALTSGAARAEEASPFGDWSLSGTVALTTNYVYRGFTQTLEDAALQASVTVGHESGFYIGFWGSNVNFGDAETDLEIDIIAGYGGSIGESTSFDINVTYYAYPGAPTGTEQDFAEFIGTISHDFGGASIAVKAAYSPDFYGGVGDAFWLAGNVSVPLGEYLTLSANVGQQWFSDLPDDADYMHYDIGATFAYENISLDVRYIDTDIEDSSSFYTPPDEYVVATLGFSF